MCGCRATWFRRSSGFVGQVQRSVACSIQVLLNMYVTAFPHGESVWSAYFIAGECVCV